MAIVVQDVVLVAGGFDLSCYFRSVEQMGETEMHDATVLCSSGYRIFQPGLTERGLSLEGFFAYDPVTDALSLDKHFHDQFDAAANRLITIGPQGGTAGNVAYLYNTKQINFNIQETVGQLLMTTFEAKATNNGTEYGFAGPGYMLLSQNVTGTVNGTTVDDGAGATTGYIGTCHVTADDFTSMTVKLQHSTDGSSWADLATFSAFSGIGADQVANTATSVNRYVRAIVSAFSGTSATVVVAIKTGFTG